MDDLPPYRESTNELGSRSTTGRSIWIKVLVLIVPLALVLMFVGLHLAGVFGPGGH